MWLSNSWGTLLEFIVFDFQLLGVVPAYVPDINACSNTQTSPLATKPKKSLESGERRLRSLFHIKKLIIKSSRFFAKV